MERNSDSFVACNDQNRPARNTPADFRSSKLGTICIASIDDVRPAAEALRDVARELCNFQVAACANIASKAPMMDAQGNALASTVFGWSGAKDQWWKKPLLALSSPLTFACRYESEPFWANADGIYTRAPNPLLDQIDLSHFRDEVNAKAVIVVPVPSWLAISRRVATSNARESQNAEPIWIRRKGAGSNCATSRCNPATARSDNRKPRTAMELRWRLMPYPPRSPGD